MLAITATTLALALALAGGNGVHRCTGTHGETVFSGQPCNSPDNSTLGAIAPRDDVHDDTCATSANELRDRVAMAFDSGDVNALGGLFLWRGFHTRDAYARMRELRALLRRPLSDIELDGPAGWMADTAGYGELPGDGTSWLSIEVATEAVDDAPTGYRFPLYQRDGCIWLGF